MNRVSQNRISISKLDKMIKIMKQSGTKKAMSLEWQTGFDIALDTPNNMVHDPKAPRRW